MMNYNDFTRPAIMVEINNYNMVENTLVTDALFEHAVELAADCIFSFGIEHKKAYNRAYRFCKAHGFTVNALTDWYCIDAY